MDRKLTLIMIIIALLVLVNAYFFISTRNNPVDAASEPVINTAEGFIAPPNQVNYFPVLDANATDVSLDAKSAILYDVNADRELYDKNVHQKLPIASLTKILNAVVVWEHFSPNDQVTVKDTAVKVDGERQDVYEGETISISSLLQMMLIESSNDAAYALRDYAATKGIDLVQEMNAKAASLGMHDTHFVDAAGLNDTGYSTASDLVKAVRYALRYDALWSFSRQATATVSSSDGKITREIKSTDQLLGTVTDIVGGKTGYTDSALGCMILVVHVPATASSADDTIIGVVLGSHGRFEDMKNLIDWARRVYHW